MTNSTDLSRTVLIVPPNDAEAIQISQIAQKMQLPVILSKQTHGASLDQGRNYLAQVKAGGYKRVVVVEMPGPKSEARLKKMGIELILIDHHHYTGLDRAHDEKTGKMLPSSLEQFLKLFRLTDKKLTSLGFHPRLVHAIGIHDRGFIWALQDEGYSKKEIREFLKYHDGLLAQIQSPRTEKRKQLIAHNAWKRRTRWSTYFIVETEADIQLRPRLSRIVALEIGKPTALIIVERKRGLIYVQESDHAMKLFRTFGGFTFGQDRNWGYRNEKGKKRVWLKEVKTVLKEKT